MHGYTHTHTFPRTFPHLLHTHIYIYSHIYRRIYTYLPLHQDATSALMLGENVRKASQMAGSACVMTLFQPSIELYNLFHNVLILTQGGKQAFFGVYMSASAWCI